MTNMANHNSSRSSEAVIKIVVSVARKKLFKKTASSIPAAAMQNSYKENYEHRGFWKEDLKPSVECQHDLGRAVPADGMMPQAISKWERGGSHS